jgi:hypothetical protein
MTQPRQEWRKPAFKISIPTRHAVGSANHRANDPAKSFPNS